MKGAAMPVRLFHSSTGKGSPLVLLHPVGLDHSFWGPLIEKASAIHTVIAVDLAGHGHSDAAEYGRAIAAYAEDVRALLDELGLARSALLGLSFGGMIAQEFAATHPERLSFIVVGACGARIPPEARAAVRARGETDPVTGMTGVAEVTLERWFTPGFMASESVRRVRERLLADETAGWAAGWDAIAGFDVHDRLGSINAPALVIAGERDAGTSVAATREMADAIRGAEFSVLSGAPHMMQIEHADRFTDRVMRFLRERHADASQPR